uniref:Uncharacterized protein n=1 Tax=Calidris pygmaea TaxID=425635 RepID=A0A8C3KLP6_9CHAR
RPGSGAGAVGPTGPAGSGPGRRGVRGAARVPSGRPHPLTLRPASGAAQCPARLLAAAKRGAPSQPISAAFVRLGPPPRAGSGWGRGRHGLGGGRRGWAAAPRYGGRPCAASPVWESPPTPAAPTEANGNPKLGPGRGPAPPLPRRLPVPACPASRRPIAARFVEGVRQAPRPRFKMAEDGETAVRRPPARPPRPPAEENDHEHCSDCENEAERGSHRGGLSPANDSGAKKKKKKPKRKKEKGGDQPDQAQDQLAKMNSLPAERIQEIQKAIELFSVGQGPAKTMEEASKRSYQFWDTQPVPKLGTYSLSPFHSP